MATNFPTSLDTLTNPTSGQTLNSPSHADQHANANDAIEALEAKVGVDSSAVTTSHDYKLSEVTDKAVGKTATQTLTNKTLTSPKINLGSDATGDMYYRNSSGDLARLAIGSSGQIIQVSSGGIPEYVSNPSAADASTTVKGVVEIATTAEITAGTSTGGTGAKLVVPADAVGTGASKIVQLDGSAKLPAVDGSQLTNLPAPSTATKITTTPGSVSVGAGSSAEANLISTSVAGGVLSTANAVRVRMHISKWERSNGGSDTITIRLKYGGTTIATISSIPAYSVAVATGQGLIEAVLYANASTSAQTGSLLVSINQSNVSGNGTANTILLQANGTASVDSTSSQTLAVTAQFSGTDSSDHITVQGITVEKIF